MSNHEFSSLSAPRIYAIGILLVVSLSVLLAIYGQLPPSPKPATAPPTEFSAERALHHIEKMAQVTHPAGSLKDDEVRAYICQQFKEMNIEVKDEACVNPDGEIGVYHNVMARIPGTANTKAFAMAAHHDSVPYGPGATDDLGGVGAMIEIARAIKAGPPLKNDVIFVFTDAEEFNGGGARAFTEHAWAKDVGLILNFEARGNSGPSYMFEISNDNGRLIAEMAKSGVDARATSVMYDVYRRSPFGSDFGAFKRHGMKGYNVAFVDHFGYYHTREDRPETLNLASLQHHGSYGLGFVRHFGNMNLAADLTAPDATYFNTIGSHMVYYPLSWGKPLAGIAAALLCLLIVLGLVRGHLTFGGLLAGVGVSLLGAVCMALTAGLLTGLIYLIYGRYVVYSNTIFGSAILLVDIAVAIAYFGFFRRVVREQNLGVGAFVCWLALLAAFELYMPGGAYLALWPLLFGIVGMGILFLASPGPELRVGLVAVTTLFALPGIFIMVPSLVGFLAMGTILFSPVIAIATALLLGLLMPQLRLLEFSGKARLPLAVGAIGVVLLLFGLATNGPSPSAPRFSCLSYGYDLDEGKAYWLSNDKVPDEWLRRFIPAGTPREKVAEFIPGDDLVYLKAPAPLAPIKGPEVRIVSDQVVNGKRELAFHLGSAEALLKVRLMVVTDAEVFGSTILGKDTGASKDHWSRTVQLFPREGVDVTLKLDPSQPLRVKMIETTYGLPAGLDIPPRPAYLETEPNVTLDFHRPLRSDHTFVVKTFTL